jgi:hypothetical protein
MVQQVEVRTEEIHSCKIEKNIEYRTLAAKTVP